MVTKSLLLLVVVFSGCGIQSIYINNHYPSSSNIVQDSITHSLFLIGDAGEPVSDGVEPTFRILTQQASQSPKSSTIIFLGDNIYPRGLPEINDPLRKEMERRLEEQIKIGTESGAQTIFIPGNHDWEYQGKNGWKTIQREEEFIESKNLSHVTLLPKHGLPGPTVVEIGNNIRIIAIDTEWWLHSFNKPLYDHDSIESQTMKRFLDSLSFVLESGKDRNVIVVAHHPLETHGEHGGFFGWKDHIFPLRKIVPWLWVPLPGIGSLYPLSRVWGISDQDLSGSKNRKMRNAIDSVLSRFNVTAYASGHEHTLQVLSKKASHLYLVSGKGIQKHQEALTYGDNTIFASPFQGFMRLDFFVNKSIRLSVIDTRGEDGIEIFSMMLP